MEELPIGISRIIVDEDTIQSRVNALAKQISEDYAHVDNLYIVGILKGAFIFLADICRRLSIPHTVDFMALSSYGMQGSDQGAVRILMDLRENIADKHVLVVEDILDSGGTLNYLARALGSRKPASLQTCVLMDKRTSNVETKVKYVGFDIPDVWVVGYGLDFSEKYRTLPYIAELEPPE
ncbi:MAG: hypoxanthine phosphoribosyltransferase [Anaerolineales bacterium]|nr:hypoxanthine phosphoribosyltransferase [Anaerolineales bacterium]